MLHLDGGTIKMNQYSTVNTNVYGQRPGKLSYVLFSKLNADIMKSGVTNRLICISGRLKFKWHL